MVYEPITEAHVEACLGLAEDWCALRRCEEDLNLLGEWDATREALSHFETLADKRRGDTDQRQG